MNVLILTQRSSPERRTQVSRLGTGSFILARGRKSRLKEREHGSLGRVKGAKSNYFRRNQMAQVTYRGIQYDTETRVQQQQTQEPQQKTLVYRGIEVKGGK